MKKGWLIITTVILGFAIFAGCSKQFVEFHPLKLQEGSRNKLLLAPELMTPDYLNRVKLVLDFYGEPYRTNETGGLLISGKLAGNEELVWNYSKKALDDSFLEQARKFKATRVK